jgi:Crp-like helix-turn-helix domain
LKTRSLDRVNAPSVGGAVIPRACEGARKRDEEGVSKETLSGLERLLEGLPSAEAEQAAEILARTASVDIEPGVPYFRASFPDAALLVVDHGFVVLRTTFPCLARSMVTFEAATDRVLLPPSQDEALFGLGRSRIRAISSERSAELLSLPAAARKVVEQLTSALGQRQEAIANLAPTRHLERVRRKLLHLAREYGHVVPDGIRIDFPLSHALLAEMIGSSRETVTRAIDALQREGFVARNGSSYRLHTSPESVLGIPDA